jgi:mono/diheme cytochrome c family protein
MRSYRTACRLLLAASAVVSATLYAQDAEPGLSDTQDSTTLEKGKALFAQLCASCHALAQDGFGPPLGGVTTLFTEAELLERIRDPGKLIASGDARAAALLRRYKAPMPPFAHVAQEDLSAILGYLHQESTAQKLTAFVVDGHAAVDTPARLVPAVAKTNLSIELEDVVQIPRLPGRTAYKGITLLRPDPREDGVLFVDELMGLLYRVKDRQVSAFLDVRDIFAEFICDPGVASGLGSFALHPEFVRNGIFYTTHSETFRGTPAINSSDIPADVPAYTSPPLEWVLTEWRLTDPTAATFAGTHREVLRFVTPTTGHGSQELAFAPVTDRNDPDYGMLYLGCGDGGSINLKRPDMAGHPRTLLGAIMRIDPAGTNSANGHYGIPADNPFAQSQDPMIRKEIWAFGFRNAHRLSWDLVHGKRMIAVDIGESNVEEVNLIEKGGSYGWGVGSIEGTARIDVMKDAKIVTPATAAELAPHRLPHGQYDHGDGPAITGGYVYRGPLEALHGKYIFGDIVNGRLFFMNFDAGLTDRTIYELNVMRDGAVTSVKALSNVDRAHLRIGYDGRTGEMYLLTKDDGMIRRITRAYVR